MSKKIEISTLNISVNVLMLDNKRFTKSVFNQLPFCTLFDEKLNSEKEIDLFFKQNDIIGYVDNVYKPQWKSYTQRCYLAQENGILYRSFDEDYTGLVNHLQNPITPYVNIELYKNLKAYIYSKISNIGQIFISC